MATRKSTTATATPATQTELEQYRLLKDKLSREGNTAAAQKIAEVKKLLQELVELREEFDIYIDFEEIANAVSGTGLGWNSSSMHC